MKIVAYHKLDYLEEAFINFINLYLTKYPFKWYYFMETLQKKKVTYARDSNLIIELLHLSNDELKRLFDIVKILLDQHFITKIIYKKEFMIIKFHSEFILSFFTSNSKWMTIILYLVLKEFGIDAYYDAYIKDEELFNVTFCTYVKDCFITIEDEIKIFKIDNFHQYILSLGSNDGDNLLFSFNKYEFLDNLIKKIKK